MRTRARENLCLVFAGAKDKFLCSRHRKEEEEEEEEEEEDKFLCSRH